MANSPPFPRGSILLDSESSESIFNDLSLLSNIRAGDPPLTLHTNGGDHLATKRGDYHGLGTPLTVWADPTSLANILALRDVRKIARVTLDTAEELAFLVHLPAGEPMRFTEHDSTGLYVYSPDSNDVRIPVKAYSYLQTISGNREMFSRRELDAADAARALHRQLGRPSPSRFHEYLTNNLIRNCPITIADAKRAGFIYGADTAYLKGKTTQRPALPHVPTTVTAPLPDFIEAHHRDVTLCVDFFFVQGMAFLHVISRKIGFRSCTVMANRSKATILRTIKKEITAYAQRGFDIRDVHGDQEFECIRTELLSLHLQDGFRFLQHGIALETCTMNDHIGEVERSIRTIKEVVRATAHGMPYRRLPRQLIRGLVEYATRTLNDFPYYQGVSRTLSPNTIVTGKPAPDYNGYKLEFGAYVMLTDKTTNTPRARTFGAIAMYPSGSADKSYRFMSLVTGDVVTKAPGYWTELPISDPTIARVEHMAKSQGQPILQETNYLAEYSPDQMVDEDEYDRDYDFSPESDEDLIYDTDGDAGPGDMENDSSDEDIDESPDGLFDQEDEPTIGHTQSESLGATPPDLTDDDSIDDIGGTPTLMETHGNEGAGNSADGTSPSENEGAEPTTDDAELNMADDEGDGGESEDESSVEEPGYNLRSNRDRSYHHRFASQMDDPASSQSYDHGHSFFQFRTNQQPSQEERILHGWVMTQMSAKAGI